MSARLATFLLVVFAGHGSAWACRGPDAAEVFARNHSTAVQLSVAVSGLALGLALLGLWRGWSPVYRNLTMVIAILNPALWLPRGGDCGMMSVVTAAAWLLAILACGLVAAADSAKKRKGVG